MRRAIIICLVLIPFISCGQNTLVSQFGKWFIQPYIIAGQIYYNNQNYDSALILYQIPSLIISDTLLEMINDDSRKGHYSLNRLWGTLNLNRGKSYYHNGKYIKSITHLKIAQNYFRKKTTNNYELARCYYYLGLSCYHDHNYKNSLKYYFKSLNLFSKEEEKHLTSIAYIYLNIGNIFVSQQEYDTAIEYYKKSLHILQNQDSIKLDKISIIINNLGSIYYAKGDILNAKKSYLKAITLIEEDTSTNKSDLGMYFNNLAGLFLLEDNYDTSEYYFQKSLDIRNKYLSENHIKKGQTYLHLGIVYYYLKDYIKALEYVNKSIFINSFSNQESKDILSICKNVIDYNLMTSSLCLKAQICQSEYEITGGNERYSKTVRSFEDLLYYTSHFIKINSNSGQKAIFNDILRDGVNSALYFFSISSLNKDPEKLYQFIEFGKSIKLLNNLIESDAKISANIPEKLIAFELNIKQKIIDNSISLKKARINNINHSSPTKYLELLEERDSLQKNLDSIVLLYESNYKKYYETKYQSSIISIKDVQNIISDSSAIIEYYCADSCIYIMLITNSKIKVHRSSKNNIRNVIEKHIKNIKFYDERALLKTGKELYYSLFSMIENDIQSFKKLIIIPDEYLYQLPFESLIGNSSSKNEYSYLLYNYEISYQYSSSIWFYAMKRSQLFYTHKKKFLGIAPYSSLQPNLKYPVLPYSRKEIQNIEAQFNLFGYNGITLIDTCINKVVLKELCSNSSHIHLATHSILNNKNPELSSIIINNPNYCSGDDTFYIGDSYNLKLTAETVVLSSCKSGFGKYELGEGFISMTRGFFYSGAKNVLFTVWNVDDHFASILFNDFYSFLLSGNSPSSSLRKAKLKLLSNPESSLPIFWSGFLLLSSN